MGNVSKSAKFNENLFSSNENKILCPPLFRKQPLKVLNRTIFKTEPD